MTIDSFYDIAPGRFLLLSLKSRRAGRTMSPEYVWGNLVVGLPARKVAPETFGPFTLFLIVCKFRVVEGGGGVITV